MTQPTLDKCREIAVAYDDVADADSMPAMVVLGRGADDPHALEKTPMCRRHKVATAAAIRGVHVRAAICPTCPFRFDCGMLKQEARIAAMKARGLFIMSKAFWFLPSSASTADIVIGDESIVIDAIDDVLEFSPDLLTNVVLYRGAHNNLANAQAVGEILADIRRCLEQPYPLAALRECIDYTGLHVVAGVVRLKMTDIALAMSVIKEANPEPIFTLNGGMSDEAIENILASQEEDTAGKVLILLGALVRELQTGRDVLNSVTYDPARKVKVDGKEERQARIRVHRLQQLYGINRHSTILLTDGTGSFNLNAKLISRLEHVHVPIERDAYITGTRGKSYSRQSQTALNRKGQALTGKDGNPLKGAAEAAKRLRDEIVAVAEAMPRDVFLAGSKRVEDIIVAERKLPSRVKTAHFGKTRALNDWQECRSAAVAGRETVAIEALEDLARAFMTDDPAPFFSMAAPPPDNWPWQFWPYRASRGRRMRDGSVQVVEVDVHPDPRCQEVLEQIRESDVVQTADRCRPIFNHRDIVLMNNLVLDCTYDRILTHAELVAGGTRWERAWSASGIIPLGAADLHRVHPAIFSTEVAARHALKRDNIRGGPNLK